MATLLKTSTKYQTLLTGADIRGNNNRLINGVIGKLGRLVIVEASDFFGYSDASGAYSSTAADMANSDTEVEIAGLRKYTTTLANGTVLGGWEGQATFDTAAATATKLVSRGLILGQGACQMAFGKMPDYKFQESTDFGITSESAVEFWTEAKKTNLTLDGGSVYKAAKTTGLDFGVIAVDVAHG